MRKFKFRVWDGKKTMLDWGCICQSAFNNDDFQLMYRIFCQYQEGWIIQQFTGLTDQLGNEIYEGDIFNTKAARYKVVFERGCFWAEVVISSVFDIGYKELLFKLPDDIIPLGNIYENPELLA